MSISPYFDATDSSIKSMVSKLFHKSKKPGEKFPSRPCNEDFYKNDNPKMGIAVIINEVNFEENTIAKLKSRNGSQMDVDDLEDNLKLFGFEVRSFMDLTTSELRDALEKISNENHRENNCLLIAIMSHGHKHGVIYTTDGSIYADEIWMTFTADKCESLIGKPKIFLIQASRGSMRDLGAILDDSPHALRSRACDVSAAARLKFVIPTTADIVIYFSSVEGFSSFDDQNGSWFVQAICGALQCVHELGIEMDIMKIFTEINRAVAYGKQESEKKEFEGCKQMPQIVSMLTKIFMIGKK